MNTSGSSNTGKALRLAGIRLNPIWSNLNKLQSFTNSSFHSGIRNVVDFGGFVVGRIMRGQIQFPQRSKMKYSLMINKKTIYHNFLFQLIFTMSILLLINILPAYAQEISLPLKWDDGGNFLTKEWDYAAKDPDNILEHYKGRIGDKIVRIALADLGFSKPVLIVQKLDDGSCGYPTFFLFEHRQIFNVCTENVEIGKKKYQGINDLLLSDGRGAVIWKWDGKSWILSEKVN